MALRTVREIGDPILTKKCKEVKEMTPRLKSMIDDMFETMYSYDGVGLAAPQVGILKRVVVIDIGEENGSGPLTLINPVVTEQSGEQTGSEGCLSVPGKAGDVTRPMEVTVEALNENMEPITIHGKELLARALCHEIDHLDGKLYVDLVEGELKDVEPGEEEEQ